MGRGDGGAWAWAGERWGWEAGGAKKGGKREGKVTKSVQGSAMQFVSMVEES